MQGGMFKMDNDSALPKLGLFIFERRVYLTAQFGMCGL